MAGNASPIGRSSLFHCVSEIESTEKYNKAELLQQFWKKIEEHNDLPQGDSVAEERIEQELREIYEQCPSALQVTFDEEGTTAFYQAYFFYNERLMRFLHGLNPHVIGDVRNGVTAFLDACMGEPLDEEDLNDKLSILQTLYTLDKGVLAQVDAEGLDGIFLAGFTKASRVLEFLLNLDQEKATVSLRKKINGYTLLQTVADLMTKAEEGEEKEQLKKVVEVLLDFDPSLESQIRELISQLQAQAASIAKRARNEF